jgi:hypothetical protein
MIVRAKDCVQDASPDNQTVLLAKRLRQKSSAITKLLASELRSVAEEVPEGLCGKLGVAHRMPDIPMPEITLNRSGVGAVIGQLVAGRVPEHVGVHLQRQPGPCCRPS